MTMFCNLRNLHITMDEQELLKRKRKAQTENNRTLLLSVCEDLAELYVNEGRRNSAIKEYKILVDIYKSENKLTEYAQANRGIGEAYMGLESFKKALEHQRQRLNVACRENNRLEQQRALATIGHTYLTWFLEMQVDREKNLNAASKYFMKSLVIAETLTDINKFERIDMVARLFLNLGLVNECLGDYNRALLLLQRTIGICERHDIYELLYRGYVSIASLYEKRREYNEAIYHYSRGIDIAKKLKENRNLRCAALLVKSEALIKSAHFHDAKQALLKAYKLKTSTIKNKRLIEKNLKTVAAMCYTEHKLVVASDRQNERKKLYEKMGDLACNLKNFQKAVEYYKLMLECEEKNEVGGRELASSKTYKDSEQYAQAVENFEKEYLLCTELNDKLNLLSNIADTKEAAGAPIGEVRNVYEKAFEDCNFHNSLKELVRMVSRCIIYMRKNDDYSQACDLDWYLGNISQHYASYSDDETDSAEECSSDDDINLDEITDESDDSDIEDRQSTSKEGMARMGRRRHTNFVVRRNAQGRTPLHVACINGSISDVRHLIERGHPVNVRDSSGSLPLHVACTHGHFEIVKFLVEKGAAINDRAGSNVQYD